MNKRDDMKKCPRCMRKDNASQRFCVHCKTELFFEYRFDNTSEEKTRKQTWIKKLKQFSTGGKE